MTTGSTEGRYWDATAADWEREHHDPLWREHSDGLNRALLTAWLGDRSFGRLLKTDLFDEAVAAGLVAFLAERADLVTGIDLSRTTVKGAERKTGSGRFSCADVRALPFADGTFDVVYSGSTLDHFRSREELVTSLRELHRVLRPGGELLVTLDNLANPVIAVRNALPFSFLNRLGLVPYFVGTTCGPAELRRLLAEAGFASVDMEASLHCPRVLAVKVTRLLERGGSLRTRQWFLRWLMKWEILAQWPTRFLTGHFLAARARKTSD